MRAKSEVRGISLVKRMSSQAAVPAFHAGEIIPVSGIYRAIHGRHRVAHDVTLLAGEDFPRCAKCGDLVGFELIAEATAAIDDRDFRLSPFRGFSQARLHCHDRAGSAGLRRVRQQVRDHVRHHFRFQSYRGHIR